MITLEQLVQTIRNPDKFKGVLTKEEASADAIKRGRVYEITLNGTSANGYHIAKAAFFTDYYSFGYGVLPSGWISSSIRIPHSVTQRPSLPSGRVITLNDYMSVYLDPETVVIETIEDLVKYVNGEVK